MPAWWMPMPVRNRRCRILPNAVVNFVPLMASAIAARCSLLDTPVLASALAVSNAAS